MGFGSALLEKVDPNPDNFVGAGIIQTKTLQVGCLLRLEPNTQAQVRGAPWGWGKTLVGPVGTHTPWGSGVTLPWGCPTDVSADVAYEQGVGVEASLRAPGDAVLKYLGGEGCF